MTVRDGRRCDKNAPGGNHVLVPAGGPPVAMKIAWDDVVTQMQARGLRPGQAAIIARRRLPGARRVWCRPGAQAWPQDPGRLGLH